MRKFFALLLLSIVSPVFAQEVPPLPPIDPTMVPTVEQTYTMVKEQTATPLQNVNQTGGTPLTLYDDGVSPALQLPFDFHFYGNLYNSVYVSQNGFLSFTSQNNACCAGQPLPNFTQWTPESAPYFNWMNTHNSIFALWGDLVDYQFGNPFYKATGNAFTVGWYGVEEFGSFRQNCAWDLFVSLFCDTIGPNRFDFEITLHADNNFTINYGAMNAPVQTWRTFTAGAQGDQDGEFQQIYYGSFPSSLAFTTYNFTSSALVPIVNEPIKVDCKTNPSDTSCVIDSIITDSTTYTAATTDTSSTASTAESSTSTPSSTTNTTESLPTQSATTEIVANTSTPSETISTTEKPSDPVLAASVASEAVANAVATNATNPLASSSATQAAYRELSDEEKAAILADAIAKNVIEGALTTIAATSAASAANGSQETSTISTSTKANMGNDVSIDTNAMGMVAENNQQQTETQDTSSAMDILDTGRTIGQQALTNILATSAEFADQAGQQAESIAQGSSVNTGSQELTIKDINQEFTAIEIPMLSQDVQKAEDAVLSAIAEAVQSSDISIDFGVTDDGRPKEIPGLANSVELEQQTLAILDTIKQSAETPTFDDDSKQYEEVILSNNFDPSAAAAFGAPPSVMNLEILGVIGNKPEEKSDAEKRADQIVAANQQQMEEINKNYMDADQSGIIGAIGADTDVSSYRTAMIADAALWYKDKDIYKGIIIKDNVRGSYFLEKGNTDTYKKMVDEQYK